jgi:hypothetical protein
VRPQQHAVTVYDREHELVAMLTAFTAEGLGRGERVLLVLTPAHRAALEAGLSARGVDVADAASSGDLRTLDAPSTLATFLVGGALDVPAFTATATRVLDEAAAGGRGVRVFGEMVNVLWDAGHARAALELEALWNELAQERSFALHCAYSTSALQAHPHLPELDELGRLHSALEPPHSYTDSDPGVATGEDVDAARAFVATGAAVGAARRWVEAVLLSWNEHDLVHDAVLVTSELATNAVRHASSAFRARLSRAGGTVRLSFEDLAHTRPAVHDAGCDATAGRGVAIVEQTSVRWGLQTTDDGKIVWAEFASRAA